MENDRIMFIRSTKKCLVMKILLYVFALLCTTAYAQENSYYYANLSYAVDKLGFKPLADSLMDHFFELQNYKNVQARLFVKSFTLKSQLKQKRKSLYRLHLAVQNGADSVYIIKQIRREKLADSTSLITFLRKNYRSDRIIHLEKRNETAIYMITELNAMDQGIRKIVDSNIPNVDKDCIASIALHNTGILYSYFYDYLQNYPFPSVDEVGYKAIDDISTYTLHFGSELDTAFTFLDKVLKNAIKNKGYIPGYYAVFVDFHRRKIGLNDYYGNEMFKRNEDDSFSYFQIDDISTVDSRRAEIGLAPLYFHANHWNMKLPEGYSFDLEKFLADLRREIKN